MAGLYERIVPVFGLLVMMGIALAVSTNRQAALKRWDLVAWGVGLQLIFAFLILRGDAIHFPYFQIAFEKFNYGFSALLGVTQTGSEFVFGPSVNDGTGGDFATVAYVDAVASGTEGANAPAPTNNFFLFATQVLPTVIFFSALTAVLYHLGILQVVVKAIAWVMQKTLKTSGAETLSGSANIFLGQTEAPLVVRPYIEKMTQSELMTVMVGGFATVAGGVMAAYVGMLQGVLPGIAGHLLAASIMCAPGAIVFSKLMVPEEDTPVTAGTTGEIAKPASVNVVDAAAMGTTDGVSLALNVGGMLIAFIALVALVDMMLQGAGRMILQDATPEWLSLRGILGCLFAPLAYLLGVTDWNEAMAVGRLLGLKIATNEFVSYLELAAMQSGDAAISQRSALIASYALCGFANFSSIGIQIGALSVMAPSRRGDISRLAMRAMFCGVMATCSAACVAAILM